MLAKLNHLHVSLICLKLKCIKMCNNSKCQIRCQFKIWHLFHLFIIVLVVFLIFITHGCNKTSFSPYFLSPNVKMVLQASLFNKKISQAWRTRFLLAYISPSLVHVLVSSLFVVCLITQTILHLLRLHSVEPRLCPAAISAHERPQCLKEVTSFIALNLLTG